MEKEDLRIVFMGTPEFAVGTLSRIVDDGYNIVAVVTQPDKPVGRHQNILQPSAVKKYALAHSIPVLQPVKMKDPAFVEELASYKADLQVVVAFRILPEVVWSMPRFGTFNVHAALLPQYRGAAPINWAVINGETKTGVTTFFLDKNIDTGRIILEKSFDIPDDADVEYVYDGLMKLAPTIAEETIDLLLTSNGEMPTQAQEGLISDTGTLHPAPKIFKETCQINWNQPAKKVYDFIRGLSPHPGAWTVLHGLKDTELKIFKAAKTGFPTGDTPPGTIEVTRKVLRIACADEWIEIFSLQPAGKKRMDATAFLNGNKDIAICHVK